MDDDGVPDDGRVSAQRKVGVGEELLGGAQIDNFSGHIQVSQFGGEISHPTSPGRFVRFAVLVDSEKVKNNHYKLLENAF